MSKLFLSVTFIATCLVSSIASADSAGPASAKHRAQDDAVPSSDVLPQSNTNTDKHKARNTNSLGAGALAKHRAQVDAVPSLRSPQSNTNTDKHKARNTNSLGAGASDKHKKGAN